MCRVIHNGCDKREGIDTFSHLPQISQGNTVQIS